MIGSGLRLIALIGALLWLLAGGAPAAPREVLRVFNWSDYIGADTVARFEAETGIDVIYRTFDSSEEMEAALVTGLSGFDVVVPTSDFLRRSLVARRFRPLDRSRIPNWRELDQQLMAQVSVYDPGNRFGAIYLWGTTGIGYNVDMVRDRLGPDAPVDSWALLLDPANAARLADCGIMLLDTGNEVLPPILSYLGLPPDSLEPAHLAAAAEAVAAIRPYVRAFHSSDYLEALASGEVCAALGWSGDVLLAAERAEAEGAGVVIAYAAPREGTVLWFDMLAIPADAPNPVAAHAFIDFLLRPEIMAGVTDAVFYPNAVPASRAFLDPAVLADPLVYPSAASMDRLFVTPPRTPEAERAMARLWRQVRGGG